MTNPAPPANRLLIIGYVWPEPNSSAAGTRMMQLIHTFLAHGYDICFASPANKGEHQVDLTQLGIREQPIVLNDASFDVFLSQFLPGRVIFDRFMMEEQFGWRVEKHCPTAIRVLNTEDLHSLRDARHVQLKQAVKDGTLGEALQATHAQNPTTLFELMSQQDMAVREIAAIWRSDLTLMISAFETQLLQDAFGLPKQILHTLPFMYEPKTTPQPSFAQRQHFVCIGNFRHAPNWDAVLMLKQLWPAIRQALPHAQLHIYGAYPPKKATELHNIKQGFLVKGWAEDALTVIGNAKVMLAPIRFGAGIKGKLAEAMLCGTPSVTTALGAESMCEDTADWNGYITQTASEFVAKAIELYHDETQWKAAQTKGNQLFEQNYAQGEKHQDELLNRLEILQNQLQTERQTNFTGQMLRHHHHKSTQYMAQWIEAKNKLSPPEI